MCVCFILGYFKKGHLELSLHAKGLSSEYFRISYFRDRIEGKVNQLVELTENFSFFNFAMIKEDIGAHEKEQKR